MNFDPEAEALISASAKTFLSVPQDPENTIFLQLTKKEAAWIHFAGALAIEAINASRESMADMSADAQKYLMVLFHQSIKTDTDLWQKLCAAIEVQFGLEPEDL